MSSQNISLDESSGYIMTKNIRAVLPSPHRVPFDYRRFMLYDAKDRLKRSFDCYAVDYWSRGLFEPIWNAVGLSAETKSTFHCPKQKNEQIYVKRHDDDIYDSGIILIENSSYSIRDVLDAIVLNAFSAAEDFSRFIDIRYQCQPILANKGFEYAQTLYGRAYEIRSRGFGSFRKYLVNETCSDPGYTADYREARTSVFVRGGSTDEKDIITIRSLPLRRGLCVFSKIVLGVTLSLQNEKEKEELYSSLERLLSERSVTFTRAESVLKIPPDAEFPSMHLSELTQNIKQVK